MPITPWRRASGAIVRGARRASSARDLVSIGLDAVCRGAIEGVRRGAGGARSPDRHVGCTSYAASDRPWIRPRRARTARQVDVSRGTSTSHVPVRGRGRCTSPSSRCGLRALVVPAMLAGSRARLVVSVAGDERRQRGPAGCWSVRAQCGRPSSRRGASALGLLVAARRGCSHVDAGESHPRRTSPRGGVPRSSRRGLHGFDRCFTWNTGIPWRADGRRGAGVHDGRVASGPRPIAWQLATGTATRCSARRVHAAVSVARPRSVAMDDPRWPHRGPRTRSKSRVGEAPAGRPGRDDRGREAVRMQLARRPRMVHVEHRDGPAALAPARSSMAASQLHDAARIGGGRRTGLLAAAAVTQRHAVTGGRSGPAAERG